MVLKSSIIVPKFTAITDIRSTVCFTVYTKEYIYTLIDDKVPIVTRKQEQEWQCSISRMVNYLCGGVESLCKLYIRVHQIFEMQILNHHMPRERVETTKMNLKYFYSVSST